MASKALVILSDILSVISTEHYMSIKEFLLPVHTSYVM